MKHSNKLLLAVLVVVTVLAMTIGPVSGAKKPNIVLVFLDNFGWGEPGFNWCGYRATYRRLYRSWLQDSLVMIW